MCGISGYFSRGERIATVSLEEANRRQGHRGPDGSGVWRSADNRVGLGHVRLSIIDLSTGAQPITSEDVNRHIIVNGEFYDFERIQRELTTRGHRLTTKSDSEIALHLYEESGVGCMTELRGEFAFALWDETQQRLFAARDRFGIKPFFYAVQDGTLYFASEIKALQAMGVRLAWDEEAIGQSLYSYVGPERTYFKGVKQLPPGCFLVATRDELRVESYWDLDYPDAGDETKLSETEWIERVRKSVSEAVRFRMRADVPVGCLLSGGLDSSAALGLARQHSSGQLKAFTIAFDVKELDESDRAERTAAAFGADFHRIAVTNREFAEVFADSVWHTEGFHYNNHGAARYLLSKAVRDAGLKVVLAGEGGDELTAGYVFCERAMGVGGDAPPAHWPQAVLDLLAARKNGQAGDAVALPELIARAQSLGFPESTFGHMTGRVAIGHGLVRADFAQRWCGRDAALTFFDQFDVPGKINGRQPVHQALYLWLKTGFANYILGGERLDMANAIEQRLPFLDHHLFELMRNVPPSLLRKDGREKWILREAMKPFVTEEIYAAKKQPFVAPGSTLRDGSEMLALAQDLLRSKAAGAVPFINQPVVLKLLEGLPALDPRQRMMLDSTILMMMSAVVLHERYGL